jgi:GMP synthase (glutamine-hydrolysing)
VVEGNTRAGREAAHKAAMMTQSELYVETLKKLRPQSRIDVVCPTDAESQLPAGAQLTSYDGIVWTGSALNVYDRTPEIERQIDLMRICFERRTQMFGSCWGLQIAAVALGGDVHANALGREIGIARQISLTDKGRAHPMYAGKGGTFDAVAIHLDHIVTPPPGCAVLATNAMSPIQAAEIRHGEAVMWGVQYHPEFDVAYIATLMRRYGEMMVNEGFCRDKADADTLAATWIEAAGNPERKDLRWRYGLGPDVLDPSRRLAEIDNWLKDIVLSKT